MSKPPFKRLITDEEISKGSDQVGLIELKYNNWEAELSSSQLQAVFDQGHSLKIFLRPSSKIKSRSGTGTYIETYDLPNIRCIGDKYIAYTDGNHTAANNAKRLFQGSDSYYAYSNAGPGYYNYSVHCTETEINTITHIMNKVRYEEMQWITKDDYQLIFDGKAFTDNLDIIKAIQAFKSFRVSLTLPKGTQIRQEVDLLFYYPDHRNLFGYTKASHHPAFFQDLNAMDKYFSTNLIEDGFYPQELNLELPDTGFPSFYNFYHDGTYVDAFMALRGEKAEYENIKIFASK